MWHSANTGTDTMAFAASALAFMLENLGKPVIFTGSQIPLCEAYNDACNLKKATLALSTFDSQRGGGADEGVWELVSRQLSTEDSESVVRLFYLCKKAPAESEWQQFSFKAFWQNIPHAKVTFVHLQLEEDDVNEEEFEEQLEAYLGASGGLVTATTVTCGESLTILMTSALCSAAALVALNIGA